MFEDNDSAGECNKSLLAAMVMRLKSEFPAATNDLKEPELSQTIEEGIRNGKQLGIRSTSLMYRFLRLRFLSEEQWRGDVGRRVAEQVLLNDVFEIEERISFIENAIIKRPNDKNQSALFSAGTE